MYVYTVDVIFETYEDIATGYRKLQIRRFQLPPLLFDDSSPRKAFECLEIIYIARN